MRLKSIDSAGSVDPNGFCLSSNEQFIYTGQIATAPTFSLNPLLKTSKFMRHPSFAYFAPFEVDIAQHLQKIRSS